MNDARPIRLLMNELPARESAIANVRETGEDRWSLRLREVDIALEWLPSDKRLALAGLIGAPPQDDRDFILQHLLVYSLLRRDTGGVRAGLDAEGRAVLLLDLHGLDPETGRVAEACAWLETQVMAWRAGFARGQAIVDAPAPSFTMLSA